MQQLHPFAALPLGQCGHARDVAAGTVEAGDEAQLDRISALAKTIGIAVVAAFAASAAGVLGAAITVT